MQEVDRTRMVPWAVLALTLVALGAVALRPNLSPFWADEAYTVLAVRARSWADLLLVNLRNEETPPLYFAIAHLWAKLWADSHEPMLRLLSTLSFAGCVPLTALIGARLWSPKVGLGGALLLAVNPFALYYAEEARAYAVATLLGLIVAFAAIAYVQRPGPRWWAVVTLGGAALCYTNYFGGLTLAGLALAAGVLLLTTARRNGGRRAWLALAGWVAAQALILLLLLPWLPAVRYQIETAAATASPTSQNMGLQYGLGLLALVVAFPDGGTLSMLLLALALLLLPLSVVWGTWRASVEQRLWLAGGLLVPTVATLLVLKGDEQFVPRYLLLAQPWLLLLIAATALTPPWRRPALRPVGPTLLVLLAVGGLAYWLTMAPNPRRMGGWHELAAQVAAQAHPGDAVFFAPPWARAPFVVQYDGPPLTLYGAESFAGYYYDGGRPFAANEFELAALQRQLARGGRAWVVWDKIYGVRPQGLDGLTVEETRYGSTGLLLVLP